MNNRGRVEHHGEFWVLVAGQELDWLEIGDTEAGAGANLVSLPGARAGGECVGMFGDIVGTVNKCRVGTYMQFFCNNDDVHNVQCMFGVSRADSTPFQWSSHLRILAQTSPSSLKSLARKVVRRQHMRKRSTCDKKLTNRLEMANMEDLVRYLDFRE